MRFVRFAIELGFSGYPSLQKSLQELIKNKLTTVQRLDLSNDYICNGYTLKGVLKADMGIICGVTTNPSLIAKEGKNFKETVKRIAEIVDGPISGEVSPDAVSAEQMIREAREIAAIHPNMVVKIPMNGLTYAAPARAHNSAWFAEKISVILTSIPSLLSVLHALSPSSVIGILTTIFCFPAGFFVIFDTIP